MARAMRAVISAICWDAPRISPVWPPILRRKLSPGEHATLDTQVLSRVTNFSDKTAEVLLMTMNSSIMAGPAKSFAQVPTHVS